MTRNASGNGFQVKSDLSRYLDAIVVAFDDPDDDDDDDGDGTGGSGDQDGDGEGGEGGDGASGSDSGIKDPEKKRLSDEAARHRNSAKSEKARADAAEAELRKLTDKDKSDLEKSQRDLQEATSRAEKAEANASALGLELAFYRSGAGALFKDHKVARRLLDLSDLTPNDDGNYDDAAIKAKAEALLKESPYLAADGSDDKGDDKPGQTPSNGRKSKDKASDQKLLEKFPALASRV